MTELAQTALDFCRECLNWPDALHGVPEAATVYRRRAPVSKRLRFTDLNSVMDAVRQWRDRTQDALDEYVTVTLSCVSGEYIGHAFIGTDEPTTAKSRFSCHALLTACVAASRKLMANDRTSDSGLVSVPKPQRQE